MIHTICTLALTLTLAILSNPCHKQNLVSDKPNKHESQVPVSTGTPVATPSETRVPVGKWGGQHVRLDVGENSAEVEFDCAHGNLAGPLILRNGRFTISGTYVLERVRVRMDGEEKGQPAHFRGQVEGSRMTLTFWLADDESDAETFELTYGKEARLFKCK